MDRHVNKYFAPACEWENEKKLNIDFDKRLGFIEITGWSDNEKNYSDYQQIIRQIRKYLRRENGLILRFKYEMFNTTTVKYLLSIIKAMNAAHRRGKSVKIYWKVNADREDEMTAVALDLGMMCKFEFKIITESTTIDSKSIDDSQVMNHRKLLFGVPRNRSQAA